jgi:mannosyltransferase
VVTAVIVAIGITVPSYWRDESATIAAVHRPAGQLIRMLGHVDAVHGAYYLLMWPISVLFGTSELVMRLPSLVAVSATAGVIAATGRRLASPAVGLAAGLLFAVVPNVSLYGQMARSYALVMLAAATASYALVRALEEETSRSRWLVYASSLAILGVLNIFGLLLIPAHAVTALAWRADGDYLRLGRERLRLLRPRINRWLAAAAFGVVVASPFLVLGYRQRGQISWETQAGTLDFASAAKLMGPPLMTVAILIVIVAGLTASGLRRPYSDLQPNLRPRPAPAPGHALALCLPWLTIPAALLLASSFLVEPVFTLRYIMFCVPAGALLAGCGLAGIVRVVPGPRQASFLAAAVVIALIAALGLHQQQRDRRQGGQGDNIRWADEVIAANWRPHDAVYYGNPEMLTLGAAYPYGLSRLHEVQVGQAAIPSGTLAGTSVPVSVLRQRLRAVRRLWVVQVDGTQSQAYVLHDLDLNLALTWHVSSIWLQLYVHGPATVTPPSSIRPVG